MDVEAARPARLLFIFEIQKRPTNQKRIGKLSLAGWNANKLWQGAPLNSGGRRFLANAFRIGLALRMLFPFSCAANGTNGGLELQFSGCAATLRPAPGTWTPAVFKGMPCGFDSGF